MRASFIALVFLWLGTLPTRAEQACGLGDTPCAIGSGNYNIELPGRSDPGLKIPAVIHFHGYGGSGKGVLKNRGMVKTFLERGYAVIAPTGSRPDPTWRNSWAFHPNRPKFRDELAFAKSVLDDASKRFNLDRDNILMSGFSIGGSLTWYLACRDPNVVKAYAPVAGAFWRPHPIASDCDGPINLLHTHGWRDGTVPLEGRIIRESIPPQGDAFYGMQILREINGCTNFKANRFDTSGKFWKRWWTNCTSGKALQFNLFDGGHGVPKGWAEEAINWFENLDKPEQG